MPAVLTPRPIDLRSNPFEGLGVALLNIYIFLLFSRIAESFPTLHLGILMMLALFGVVLISNSLYRAVVNRVGIPLMALCAWLALSIPFSVWPGGSASAYIDWLKSFAVFLITAGLLTSVRHCRTAIYTAAAGILWVALLGVAAGHVEMGRLSLDIGRYGDANDFAQIMLVGLAFWCLIASAPKRSILGKIIPIGCVAIELFAFSKTGSRGGLIGFFLTAVVLFTYSSLMGRVKLIVVMVAAIILGSTVLPRSILLRYKTMFTEERASSEQEAKDMEAAQGSKAGRTYLLKTSLLFTIRHPLTGVGLGMFAVAENDKARASGRANGSWHETHNMYTQVSSEGGVPALIFFLMAIIRAMRDVGAIRKGRHPDTEIPPTPEQRHLAYWSSIGTWGVITSGFFLSVAFTPELQFLLALLASLSRAVHQENVLPPQADPLAAVPTRQAMPFRSPVRVGASYAVPKTGY